jgi:hypothetical protein
MIRGSESSRTAAVQTRNKQKLIGQAMSSHHGKKLALLFT